MAPPQDYEYKIKGPDASLVIVDRSPGFIGPAPQQIADTVGGQFLPYVVRQRRSRPLPRAVLTLIRRVGPRRHR